MGSLTGKLKLEPEAWYAWQMIPGYIGRKNVPYCSPIFLQRVFPRKTGRGILGVNFINVFYATGVQNFTLDIRILKHSADYLIAELLDGENEPARSAVISHIEFAWIKEFCPNLWYNRPPSSMSRDARSNVSTYLSEIYGLGTNRDSNQ